MYNIKEIIRGHFGSFYDQNDSKKEPKSQLPHAIAVILLAILLSILYSSPKSNFVEATLIAVSILLGFNLNLLFFMVSNPRIKLIDESSLEGKLRIAKLTKISKELFYNVSYFSLTAINILVMCLFILVIHGSIELNGGFRSFIDIVFDQCVVEISDKIMKILSVFFVFIWYLLIVEAIYTYYSIVLRSYYYFVTRLKVEND